MSVDKGIAELIQTQYVDDDRLPHPAEIAVSEQRGNVTLRGTVGSIQQLRTAVEIAKAVRGVRRVSNELTLDPRDRWQDGELRGTALQALMTSDRVPADHIDVHVANGWLTLKGEVRRQSDSDAAFEIVSGMGGIGGITNEIKVITAGIS
jgi:osmotically-inducible protein OsmY